MNPKITIRKVNNNDSEAFVRIYKLAYQGLEEYAYTKNRDIKYYFRWLKRRDENGFLIAESATKIHGNEPVGFVACDTNWISLFDDREVGEIHELFVHPNWRGMGIGKTLLKESIEYAKSKGKDLIELWVGVTNNIAKRFYEKNGFVEQGMWGKWIRMIKRI